MIRFATVTGLLLAVAALSGCSEKKVSVSGKITRAGQPLGSAGKNLQVVLIQDPPPPGARPYSAETDPATGTFRIAALPPGRYRVGIQLFDEKFNDDLGGVYDPGASQLFHDITTDGQTLEIDLPAVLPNRIGYGAEAGDGKAKGGRKKGEGGGKKE